MVENMLLATQMDTDTFKLYQEKVDVKQFLNDLVDCYRKTIQHAHHIELVLDCDASQIEIDTFSMQIAIHNLLDNALKYGLNKPIVLSAQCSAQTLEIQVKDQGIGIDKKEQQQIFKKFYRVGNEDVRKHKGTGLGLFIVQQIIEKHKGKIELHSVLGEGSAFNIKLPLV
jgi:signal transduction histidine kinase